MPDLLAAGLMLVAGLVVGMAGLKLGALLADATRPLPVHADPRREVDMQRLEEIAAVTDAEIIAAAEWRAEHPDKPEPKVLADLDESTWTRTPAIPQVGGERKPHIPPPPPKPSRGGPTTARRDPCSQPMLLGPGVIHVPAGMPHELARRIANSPRAVVIPHGMELKPLPLRQPSPYADCQHEDADREEIRSLAQVDPVKSLVTSCLRCDRAALAKRIEHYGAQMQEISDEYDGGARVMPAYLAKHFQRLLDAAVSCTEDLARIDRRLKDAEPMTWPGRMF